VYGTTGRAGHTLAGRGLEEPRNSQELLIESVGPFVLFCVLCHIVSTNRVANLNSESYLRKNI
jgi:hypothetical protein